MSCLTNLGCLQIPTTTISTTGQQGPAGPAGATGATGATGAAGANGTDGTTRLYNFVGTNKDATTLSWITLDTFTLPANSLSSDGDSVLIQATHKQTAQGSLLSIPTRRITFNGVSTTIDATLGEPVDLKQSVYESRYRTTVEIIRTSATTATCRVLVDYDIDNATGSFSILYRTNQVNLTLLDFTVNNDIDFDVFQYVASQTELRTLTVDKYSI